MFKFPYTNFHEMNLTWIIETVNNLVDEWIAMQGDFDNLEGKFEELKQYVEDYFIKINVEDEVKKVINSMKESGELESIISDALLQGAMIRVNSPGIIILGDSYGMGENLLDKSKSWANTMKSILTENGYSCYSASVSGTGFKADGTKTYTNLITNLTKQLSKKDKDKISYIIVGGSYNDRNASESEISNGMIEFVNAVRSSYVNAKNIIICPMGWTWEGHQQGIHTSTTYISVMKANKIWQYTAPKLGCSVIPAYQAMLYESSFSNDGVHPSEQGQANILNMTMSAFNGLYFKPINSVEYGTTFTKTSAIPGKGGARIRYSIFNGTAKVRCVEFKLSEINLPSQKLDSTPLEVGTIDSPAVHFNGTDCFLPCNVILRGKETDTAGEANLFIMVNGGIKISAKKVYLVMTAINSEKRNYMKYDINQIECVNFGEFTYDPLFQ